MKKNIFAKRIQYRPFEYPELLKFIETINQTFWVHNEVDFTGDIQDFHVVLSEEEQEAVKRSLLAIAQVEVAVKSFWGNLYNYMPKPEINGLGATFAECEFRHSEAYAKLLRVLGLEEAFNEAMTSEVLLNRMNYLDSRQQLNDVENPKLAFTLNLIVFSMLIENVSLFSQFAIVLSFTHHRGQLKNTSNIIAWTSKDEQIHANAGIYLFNEIIQENPDWITEEVKTMIRDIVEYSMNEEIKLLDWIFEKGELEHISKNQLVNFMKSRVNDSMKQINLSPIFEVDSALLNEMQWFNEEIFSNTLDDFFAKRPVDYTKHNQAVTADDLF
ncbi:MAG: ribonucleotide-diphosphate reductase subunit beta [Flavobacteriales bacterium]|nr:ribonucleotide-diphosphate reductase subunit beta [Flavobacteriales bacterium]